MGSPVIVRNIVDTWVNETTGSLFKNYGEGSRLRLKAGTPTRRYAFLHFPRPFPVGARVINARLVLRSAEVWAGSVTLSVQRVSAKWDVNKVNWNNQPGVTGAIATLARTGAPTGGVWDIDITPLMNTVATGGAWYGLRITTDRTTESLMYSAQAAGEFRPYASIEWVEEPDEPDNLSPGGGRSISVAKPIVQCDINDNTGDTILSAVQVQIGTSEANVNAGVTTYDSGEVPSTVPELDLSRTDLPGGVYAGIADGATIWWRMRGKDSTNVWGLWSDATSVMRDAAGTVTMTSPADDLRLTDPSPTITWTVAGLTGAQKHYQVWVLEAARPDKVLWTSGKVTSAVGSCSVPFGVIVKDTAYRIILRVWDSGNREPIPNDPAYIEVVRDVTPYYDNTIGVVAANLSAASDPLLPVKTLTWGRSGVNMPDSWVIMRSTDAGVTWSFLDEAPAADLLVAGVQYRYKDASAASYTPYQWRVVAMYAGKMSGSNPVVSGEVRRLAPFLMRRDSTDAVVFLNPKRSRQRMDKQEIHETMAGPVLVTQYMGRYRGSVEGRLATESGVATADVLLARFQRLRDDSGQPMTVVVGNKSYKAVAFNFQDDIMIDTSGITYLASFDWIEVP